MCDEFMTAFLSQSFSRLIEQSWRKMRILPNFPAHPLQFGNKTNFAVLCALANPRAIRPAAQ